MRDASASWLEAWDTFDADEELGDGSGRYRQRRAAAAPATDAERAEIEQLAAIGYLEGTRAAHAQQGVTRHDPARSAGLHAILSARGDALTGIRNGIDASIWNPAADPLVPTPYSAADPTPKDVARAALLETVGWGADDDVPTIGMVTRLVEQKGIDIALGLVPYLERMRARLVLLGSGEERLSLWAKDLASRHPDHLHFVDGYDVRLAHSIFAGSDLFLMPSRFEPCGLAQMQAMAYGSIPVVTPVGGLVDTVFDADEADRETGNGFMSLTVDGLGVLDALHRAVAAWRDLARRRAIQWAGMAEDWSWEGPAEHHMKLYRDLLPGDASE